MPSYPVLQPDGKLAIWSTVVDHFTYFDCDQADAVSILAERYRDGDKVAEYVAQVAAGTIPLDWWQDWPGCLAWATFMHGEEDETVKEAMERTPDAMTRRYIVQFMRTCQADGRTEDARRELATMTKRAEEAEFKLAAALGADKPDKPATPTERARLFAMVAAEQGRRARQAEAERDATAATVAELVAANNQVAAINADLTAQLAAVGTYARYYAAANDAYMAVGRPPVLFFEEWYAAPHCPNCGNVQVDRAPGPGADLWECAGRDGCGYNWRVEPEPPSNP